jgi:EmrB/QacA subfamily drug resistance transporter
MATPNIAPGEPQPIRRGRLHGLDYKYQALIVVMVGMFMVMIDTTVVNIALNRIITIFGATVSSAQLVLTVYMLSLAIIMPATGYLSDTFGTKRLYVISMTLFTLGSLLCGLAWNVPSLVVFRVLQGLGGGMMNPLGMTIILKTTRPEERGRIMGLMSLPMVVAPVIGPTLGGYLVEYVDWRLIFYINIPIGFLGVMMGLVMLRETAIVKNLKFDLPGFLLAGSGFGSLLYGLSQAPTYGWGTPWILALVVGGSFLLVIWVIVELNTEKPLLQLRIFKNVTFTLATIVNLIMTLSLFSSMFLLPIFLQSFRGLGALETGLILFPQAVAAGVMAPISGWLYDKFGPKVPIISGMILMAMSTYPLSFLTPETSSTTVLLILIARGASMGLAMMPVMTVALNAYPTHLAAEGSSLTNVLRQLFGSFGTAIFATLLSTRQTFHQAMYSQAVTPDLFAVKSLTLGVQQYALVHGLSIAQAKALASSLIVRDVMTRAGVRAFEDCFLVAAIASLFAIIPVLFFKKVSAPKRGGPAAATE